MSNKFNLAGKSEKEKVEHDMYMEQCSDTFNNLVMAIFAPDADKLVKVAKYLDEYLPASLTFFENKLAANKSGFLIGDSLTAVDLFVASTLDKIITHKVFDNVISSEEAALAKFPLLKALRHKVRAVPEVQAWNKAHDQVGDSYFDQ